MSNKNWWQEFMDALSCKNCLDSQEPPDPAEVKFLDGQDNDTSFYKIKNPYNGNPQYRESGGTHAQKNNATRGTGGTLDLNYENDKKILNKNNNKAQEVEIRDVGNIGIGEASFSQISEISFRN